MTDPTDDASHRALAMVKANRNRDHEAFQSLVGEHTNPVLAGATVTALVLLVNRVLNERPSDPNVWLDHQLANHGVEARPLTASDEDFGPELLAVIALVRAFATFETAQFVSTLNARLAQLAEYPTQSPKELRLFLEFAKFGWVQATLLAQAAGRTLDEHLDIIALNSRGEDA